MQARDSLHLGIIIAKKFANQAVARSDLSTRRATFDRLRGQRGALKRDVGGNRPSEAIVATAADQAAAGRVSPKALPAHGSASRPRARRRHTKLQLARAIASARLSPHLWRRTYSLARTMLASRRAREMRSP